MSENNEGQEEATTEQGETSGSSRDGNKSEEPEILRQAREEREGLDKVRQEAQQTLKELKETIARSSLSGNTEVQSPQKKEETPEEYAKKALEGKLN